MAAGKYTKSDLQKAFGIPYHHLDKVIEAAGKDLPVGQNLFNQFKIFTDDTVEYIEKNYGLKAERKHLPQ